MLGQVSVGRRERQEAFEHLQLQIRRQVAYHQENQRRIQNEMHVVLLSVFLGGAVLVGILFWLT